MRIVPGSKHDWQGVLRRPPTDPPAPGSHQTRPAAASRETMLQPSPTMMVCTRESCMQDVLEHLNDALAALRQVSEVSREDANAIQKTIAALDVTVRLKASNEAPLNDMRSSWLSGGYRAETV